MKNHQIVILAGGLGTRLFPITKKVPKVLATVAGRPYIFWQMDLLCANNIQEIILCLGVMGEQVERELGQKYKNITIRYSYEDSNKLLGTAGAIKNAEEFLNPVFGVLYGDSYLEMNYRAVFDAHLATEFPATMTVWMNKDRYDISNVSLSENKQRVTCYNKRKTPGVFRYIDYGFSVFNKDIIVSRLNKNEYAALNDLQLTLSSENILGAFEVDTRFYEIGSKAGLAELEQYLSAKAENNKEISL